VRRFGGWGSVADEGAFIEFGGGFYHFGYHLERDSKESTAQTNVWRLYFRSEDTEGTLLCAKSVPKTRRLSAAELLKRVLEGYDESLAKEPRNDATHKEKIQLLLRFDKVREARRTCKEMLDKLPEDWWANLVCALVMASDQSEDNAEGFLAAWAKRNPSFFSCLDLAYYYQRRGLPKKAAEAMVKAADYPADVTWGHSGNSDFRGYNAAVYAYRTGEYQAAIKLCDKLLPVTTNGDYAKKGLRELRAAAQAMAEGKTVKWKAADEILGFDPFERVDIEKLLRHDTQARRKKHRLGAASSDCQHPLS